MFLVTFIENLLKLIDTLDPIQVVHCFRSNSGFPSIINTALQIVSVSPQDLRLIAYKFLMKALGTVYLSFKLRFDGFFLALDF